MTVGLVLGKFAPLHQGHQRLIEASLAETDHTIVLIYDAPGLDSPPLSVRSQWISELYPNVEVLQAWDGPTETGLTPEITAQHDAYLKRRVGDRLITHFFSSEPYGEHVSRGLGAIDRRVDESRSQVPISATEIRNQPFMNRHFVPPKVYRDLITKVVIVGAPSTGKTTLAAELARRFDTVWMPEYGREYWEQHQVNRRLTQSQLVSIAIEHRRREDELILGANRYCFIDTDATTTLQFSKYYHDAVSPELTRLAEQAYYRYEVRFLCMPDIPYDDTWDRSGDVNRFEMHRRITDDFISHNIPFHLLTGTLEQRVARVCEVLADRTKAMKSLDQSHF